MKVGNHIMLPDVILEVYFKTSAEGGRSKNIELTARSYGCSVFVGDDGFESRFILSNKVLELGKTYAIPIKFLHPELVLPLLALGKTVCLWEGKVIAMGKVIRLPHEEI